MQKRRLGRTGHASTVAIFGGAAFWTVGQRAADAAMETVIAAGVNHIDVAPSYGVAEQRLGPWMKRIRAGLFLGCKTTERSARGAGRELRSSLRRLRVDAFDLYQFHAVNRMADLDAIMAPGGALEAVCAAREKGLTRWIGITGHGSESPRVLAEALRRFPFDTVMFPVLATQFTDPAYRRAALALLRTCARQDVGVMALKAVARGKWGLHPKAQACWYRPFTDPVDVQRAVDFALSHRITGICTTSDIPTMQTTLLACARHAPMSPSRRLALLRRPEFQERLFDPL